MSEILWPDSDLQILFVGPESRDFELTCRMLKEVGLRCVSCCVEDLDSCLLIGAAALLLPEEQALQALPLGLGRWLEDQPSWSDLPILVLARPGADSAVVGQMMSSLGNVTVLERPMRVATLISAASSAIKARKRQYQIRDQVTALEQAYEDLRRADRRKDEFLATLGHELRNPLAPIRSAVDLLIISAQMSGPSEELLHLIGRQITHMVRLIDDLMEISRITTGKITLRKTIVNLKSVLADAITASKPLIESKSHDLIVNLPQEDIFVLGDSVRISQIFSNLITNSAKYTDPGGQIEIFADKREGVIQVHVRDNGSGILPEMLPLVFDVFTQSERNRGQAEGGLGIGLTLVRKLAELHGGSVVAESKGAGMGSTFTVELPTTLSMDLSPDSAPVEHQRWVGKRVLVVDDNDDAAKVLSNVIEHLGAEVVVAADASEALAKFEAFSPAIAILDIGLPDMDGFELAKKIRERQQHELMLIAVTGWGQAEDRRRSEQAGFDYHLVKPVEISAITSLLSHHL